MKKLYTIWVVCENVGIPKVCPVDIKETAKRVEVLTNSYAVGFRTFLYLDDDPELKHRTQGAAIKYWHKQNTQRIAQLKLELQDLEILNNMTPIVDKPPSIPKRSTK